jgi:outer membrane protein TolC
VRRALALAGLALLIFPGGRAAALTLAEGLAIVDRSGRDVAVALAEEQVVASYPRQAAAAWRPSVDLYARETLLAEQPAAVFNGNAVPTAEEDSFTYGFTVRQQVYDFGRTDAAVRAAGLDAEAARLDTALVRNRAALRFILAYVRLLRAERLLAVQREEVARFEAQRNDTRALLEEGTVTENDLLEAEVRLADAEQRRLQAENQLALVAARVNSMLLRPLGSPVPAEEIGAAGPGAEPLLEEALAEAARDRIELKQLACRVAAVDARRAGVRAEYYPQLYASGGYGYTQNQYQVHEGNWAVGAGAEMNLYAGGLTSEKIRQKELELQALERARERLLDAVGLEVKDAHLSLGTARARVTATGKAVEQAQENLRLERLRYSEGVGTSTDVLDAVSLLTVAEQNQLDAHYDVTDARALLDFARGRDLVATWGAAGRATEEGGRP